MIPYRMNPLGISGAPYKRKLDYLESTGTQWIDTGVVLGSTDVATAECTVSVTETSSQDLAILGTLQPNFCILYSSGKLGSAYRQGTGSDALDYVPEIDRFYKLVLKNGFFAVDATEYKWTSAQSWKNTESIYLFASHYLSSAYGRVKCRMRYVKFLNGKTLLFDVIPVLDNNDVPCMYDKVSKTFFYNQGSGQFLYGEKA